MGAMILFVAMIALAGALFLGTVLAVIITAVRKRKVRWGLAVCGAAASLLIGGIGGVRQGKVFDIELDGAIAAFGGKKEIMSIIGHGVAQGGTYTNNKPGVAGAYATLNLLKSQPILKTIEQRGQRLMDGLKEIFDENDILAVFTGYPAMFSFSLGVEAVTCQRDWALSDHALYLNLVEKAIECGVMPDHDAREPWFLCYSHSEADIDETLNVYAEIVKEVKR